MGPTGCSRIVQVHPTRRCNLRCLHCYSSSGPEERGGLPAALLRDALTDAAAEGYTVAGFSGGEPVLYPALREVLEHAHGCGMRTTVTSNGMLLDARRLERLAGAVDLLAISLDGVPESHDRMRADPRAFSTMASRLDGVRRSGIPFGFIFTLTQHNLHELEWVAGFALENGAGLLQIHPLEETGRAGLELAGARPDGIETAYAFLLAERLQEAVGDRLLVQLDLVSRRRMQAQPDRFFAAGAADPERPLSDLVAPIIIEPDGLVMPIEYGLAREHAIGDLNRAPLRQLAVEWRRSRYAAFRELCQRAFEASVTQAAEVDSPLTNWYDAVREAGGRVEARAVALSP